MVDNVYKGYSFIVDSVDLLSRTIRTTVVVSDWCILNLAHDW